MKIEIDLSEIFEDEEKGTFHFPVKEQIINGAIESVKDAISSTIKDQIAKQLNLLIESEVKRELSVLIPNLLDTEYQITTSWGEPKEKTTVRQKLHKTIEEQMVYKSTGYSHDRNQFTKSVHEAMEERLKVFKEEYNKQVNVLFKQEAHNYAINKLKETLGLK